MLPAAVHNHCVTLFFFHNFLSKRPLRRIHRIEYYCVWVESFMQGDRMSTDVVMKNHFVQISSKQQALCFVVNSFSFEYLKRVPVQCFSGQLFLISSRKLTSFFPSFTLFFKRPKLYIAEKFIKKSTALLTSTVLIYRH